MRLQRIVTVLVAVIMFGASAVSAQAGAYRNFRVAIYVPVGVTIRLADPAEFNREFARVSSQLGFDKVYIEGYRGRTFATDTQVEAVKRAFQSKGIATAGGVTFDAGSSGGQFNTLDYENPVDRETAERASRLMARHFDELILDDFFFYNTKSDADIAAKGSRSWTDYRIDKMHEVARDLVLGPAKQVNPRIKVVIKYPNWYEHFHGTGFDLGQEARMFDGIYTGTETRDPVITDQQLQQYESYQIIRYFDNVRPDGGNGGGWVDTYSIRSVDRYAEQLWDTEFAKAPQIVLFEWSAMASDGRATAGERHWAKMHTSFDWNAIAAAHPNAGWATAANAALHVADTALNGLGNPVGVASYRPPHASGEDFLHNYIGNLGVPIELYPQYPAGAHTILLTQAASTDPQIIAKVDASLRGGANVIVTSGFLEAMQGRGFEQLAEWHATGHTVAIDQYFDGFGAGNGTELKEPGKTKPVLFPEVRFYTNDSWGIIRGVAAAKGFPMVLMNQYSKGTLYLWTMPENFGDLYSLPQPMITRIKRYLFADAPVTIDAPDHVALFTYDNGAFVVENFRDEAARVGISRKGAATSETVTLSPHSFRVFH
jgi:hypothetical protein